MTFSSCIMPSQARCDRVPPAHGPPAVKHAPAHEWDAVDLSTQDDSLPLDPRSWSRAQVATWVSQSGGQPSRFPMNGKALCLMSRDMFAARVPAHGHRLHYDFRRRLAKALALQELIEKMSTNY